MSHFCVPMGSFIERPRSPVFTLKGLFLAFRFGKSHRSMPSFVLTVTRHMLKGCSSKVLFDKRYSFLAGEVLSLIVDVEEGEMKWAGSLYI